MCYTGKVIETKNSKNDLKNTLNRLVDSVNLLKKEFKPFATKDDLKNELSRFATKDDLKKELERFATKDELKTEIDGLAVMTKQEFEGVDFRFTIIEDRLGDIDKRFDRVDGRLDHLDHEVAKTNDSFARLRNYIEAETAAFHSHPTRVDEKIGLA